MKWVKVSLTVSVTEAEAASAWLWEVGAGGVVETSPACSLVTLDAYLPYPGGRAADRVGARARARAAVESLRARVGRMAERGSGSGLGGNESPAPRLTTELVDDAAWTRAWKDAFGPCELPGGLVVVPSWKWRRRRSPPEPGRAYVRLDPGLAFGTGLHPTTQVSLDLLRGAVFPGCSVVDVGCGSGILAIASYLWGAGRVLAVDCDPVAVEVARANVRRNGAQRVVRVAAGDLLRQVQGEASAPDGGYDVVVANITVEPILNLITMLGKALGRRAESRFVACGLREEDLGVVEGALAVAGLSPRDTRRREGWVGISAAWEDSGGDGPA